MEGYKFIAGAICPSCKEQDSIVLKDDDSEVKCISCNSLIPENLRTQIHSRRFSVNPNNIIDIVLSIILASKMRLQLSI